MLPLRDLSTLALAGCLAGAAMGLLALAALIGLRLQRRGSARFWASPGALAVVLLPAAVGTLFGGLVLNNVLRGMALAGAGGVAAIAAGCAEALTPILVGIVVTLGLTAAAFLMTAVGSSRSIAPAGGGLAGWALLGVAVLALGLVGGVVGHVLSIAAGLNANTLDPASLPVRVSLALAGAVAAVVVALALALAAAFVAPRGPAGLGMTLVSLATLAFCGLLGVAGLWATWHRSQLLMQTAITGDAEGAVPEPVQGPLTAEPTAEPPTAEPPAPDLPRRQDPKAVRVGGTIREPRKIRNVSPLYPELAKQARVQGVVILEATISPRGDVTSVRVLRGIPLLDQAAIDAVKQWVYEPTLLDGVPVPVIMTVTVNYKLTPG